MFALLGQLWTALSAFVSALEKVGNTCDHLAASGEAHAKTFRLEAEKSTAQAQKELDELLAK